LPKPTSARSAPRTFPPNRTASQSPVPCLSWPTEIFPANDRDKYVKYPAASQYHSKRPPDQSNLQSAGSSFCIRNRQRISRVSRRQHHRISTIYDAHWYAVQKRTPREKRQSLIVLRQLLLPHLGFGRFILQPSLPALFCPIGSPSRHVPR